MPFGCLITISPIDISTGSQVTIYTTSVNDRAVTGLNGQVWEPAVTQTPMLGISLWNGDFQAATDPANATFAINMEVVKKTWPNADQYMWVGAPVKIYAEQIGTAWPWTQRFAGRVSSFNRRAQNLSITAKVETEPLAKNVLTATYVGTGGIEGGTDLKNRLKPLVIGYAANVEPILIDAVNLVYQFCAYGAIEGVSALYERASDFGASSGDYATYAALVAATVPAGGWATCLASGLVRLGAPAYGVITGDVRGYKVGGSTPRLTGSIINALATLAGVSGSQIDTTSLATMNSAAPYNANLVLTEQTKFIEIASSMALACNFQAAISLNGQFFVAGVSFAPSPTLTLNAQGKASPQVITSDEMEVSIPYWKTIMGANRSWRVHTPDEVALADFGDLAGLDASGLQFGTNQLANSEMLLTDPTYGNGVTPVGFQDGWNGNSTNLGSLSFNDRRVPLKDGSFAYARDVTGGTPNGTVVDCLSSYPLTNLGRYAIPVVPGDRIALSALIGYQNCTGAYVIVNYFDENGAYVDEYAGAAITASIGSAAYNTLTRKDLVLATHIHTVPADGTGGGTGKRRWATINHRFGVNGSSSNPRLLVAAPMIAKVPAGQAVVPPYTPGPPDRQASFGAVTGNNLVSAAYGTLGDSQIKTDLGTAAAIAGQGLWATAGNTPFSPADMLSALKQNYVYNPCGSHGLDGWVQSGPNPLGVAQGSYGEGFYFWTGAGSNASTTGDYQDHPCAAGAVLSIQAQIFAGGLTGTGAQARVYVEWVNGSGGHVGYSATCAVNAGNAWTWVSATGQVAPAGTAIARVWIDIWGPGTYSNTSCAWTKLKVEQGTTCTPFSDDSTYGALYADRTPINSLKPGQAGADVTGSNTAAGIAGQAATATNSDYSAVTGTKPPSNATNGAPTGTPVGSISAGDVSSTISPGGGVAPNNVNTAAMVLNAATDPGSFINLATGSITGAAASTWYDFASITVSLSSSTDTVLLLTNFTIYASVPMSSPGTALLNVRLVRGSTVLKTFPSVQTNAPSAPTIPTMIGTAILKDVPGAAGSYTYKVQVNYTVLSGTASGGATFGSIDGAFAPLIFKR